MKPMIDACFRLIEALMVLCLAAMVVMVFGNVVLRYGFHTGIVFSEEMSRYLFVWVIFLGAIVAMRENIHIRVDGLVRRLPAGARRACTWASAALMLLCCWLLLDGDWKQVRLNWDIRAQVSGLPMPWVYVAIVVCAIGLALVIVAQLLRPPPSAAHADDEQAQGRP